MPSFRSPQSTILGSLDHVQSILQHTLESCPASKQPFRGPRPGQAHWIEDYENLGIRPLLIDKYRYCIAPFSGLNPSFRGPDY
jgi:hypothetical protein